MIIRDKAHISVSEKQPNIQINKTLTVFIKKGTIRELFNSNGDSFDMCASVL